jgi:hypothetical protein
MRSVSAGEEDFRKFQLVNDEEHAAKLKPHAMMAMTRLMIWSPPLGRQSSRPRPARHQPYQTISASSEPASSRGNGLAAYGYRPKSPLSVAPIR